MKNECLLEQHSLQPAFRGGLLRRRGDQPSSENPHGVVVQFLRTLDRSWKKWWVGKFEKLVCFISFFFVFLLYFGYYFVSENESYQVKKHFLILDLKLIKTVCLKITEIQLKKVYKYDLRDPKF